MAIKAWFKEHRSALVITITGVIVAWLLTGIKPSTIVQFASLLTSWLGSFLVAILPLPVWIALLAFCGVAVCLLRLFQYKRQISKLIADATQQQSDADARAATLQAEIEQLRNPAVLLLNDAERQVLRTISNEIEKQKGFPCFADLKRETGFSHLVTEGAIDVLLKKGLMQREQDRMGILRIHLTSVARAYLLKAENSPQP